MYAGNTKSVTKVFPPFGAGGGFNLGKIPFQKIMFMKFLRVIKGVKANISLLKVKLYLT